MGESNIYLDISELELNPVRSYSPGTADSHSQSPHPKSETVSSPEHELPSPPILPSPSSNAPTPPPPPSPSSGVSDTPSIASHSLLRRRHKPPLQPSTASEDPAGSSPLPRQPVPVGKIVGEEGDLGMKTFRKKRLGTGPMLHFDPVIYTAQGTLAHEEGVLLRSGPFPVTPERFPLIPEFRSCITHASRFGSRLLTSSRMI